MLFIFLGVISDEEKDLVNEIFSNMNEKMYYTSYGMLQSTFDAEEAVAQTFLKIMENIDKVSTLPRSEKEPYCFTILKNEARNIINKRKKTSYVEDVDFLEYDRESYSIEDKVIKIIDLENLFSCANSFSDDEKSFVYLRFLHESSYKDISQFFNISEEAAKKRGQRILKKLRLIYERKESHV